MVKFKQRAAKIGDWDWMNEWASMSKITQQKKKKAKITSNNNFHTEAESNYPAVGSDAEQQQQK